ncbi:MAG: reverse transcriptase domain-containing protein [Ktedonobacteraceae bacterium]
MLPAELSKRLTGLEDASEKGYPLRNLYRLMYSEDLWVEAYANIQSNKGALTPGVDSSDTLDGFSKEKVSRIVDGLRGNTYIPKPVRREEIPKGNGKMRPLGIPSGTDKLVQEVTRTILERIYEPIFSDASHGFRRGRSCHTALSGMASCWNGTKWLIDVDIKGCFDNIDHNVLLGLLRKKVDDKRFVHLIEQWLKAGYMHDWKYHGTYSGTPQGGIISPILANIYLHELDTFVNGLKDTYDSGKARRLLPEYQKHQYQILKCRKRIDAIKGDPAKSGEVESLRRRIAEHMELRQQMPSVDTKDPSFKRLKYVRYADDFVIGIIGSRVDAENILRQVKNFISNELKLEVNEEKTKIRHATEGVRFLGYEVRQIASGKVVKAVYQGRHTIVRSTEGIVKVHVPSDVPLEFCNKHGYGNYHTLETRHRGEFIAMSVPEIIATYNAEMRGLAQYYALASNVKEALGKLYFLWQSSLFKTIANKRRTSVAQIASKLRTGSGEYEWEYEVGGKSKKLGVYKLKHLEVKSRDELVDLKPKTAIYTLGSTELVARLNANRCEYCDSEEGCEVHHIRKLKDLQRKPKKTLLEQMMIARLRKTMVLCKSCHTRLHNGTLPDMRRAVT